MTRSHTHPVHFPPPQGLYDPANEKDSCGVGFVVNYKGVRSHEIVEQGLEVLLLQSRHEVGRGPRRAAGIAHQVQDDRVVLHPVPVQADHAQHVAAAALRALGVPRREAARIASRPLPQPTAD